MARRGWLSAARALLSSTAGVLGGLLGATAGGIVGVMVGIETAPARDIPAHEDFLGGFLVLMRAAAAGVVGAVVGAIGGAIFGTLGGIWAARKALPPQSSGTGGPTDGVSGPTEPGATAGGKS
jgi:hypothetical protein